MRARVRRALESRVGHLLVAVFLALVALGVGAALVSVAILLLERAGVTVTAGTAVVLSAVLMQGVTFAGVSLVYLRLRGLSVPALGLHVPDFRDSLAVASGYVLALLGALTMAGVAVLAGLQPAHNRIAQFGRGNPEVFLLLAVLSVLVIGPGEELLFRGVVQGSLRRVFEAPAAVVLATIIFAAAHTPSLAGPLSGRAITVGLLFVPGLVLGVAYEYTDNIAVPALIHGSYNATLFVLAYASMTLGDAAEPAAVGAWAVVEAGAVAVAGAMAGAGAGLWPIVAVMLP